MTKKSIKTWARCCYLIAIHLVLGFVLWKSNFVFTTARYFGIVALEEQSPRYRSIVQRHSRRAVQVPAGATLIIGDSLVESMCVTTVCDRAVNFGIGGDTTVGVLNRLKVCETAIDRASFVVIAIGVNDFLFRDDEAISKNIQRILQQLPNKKVMVSAVLPVDEKVQQRATMNSKIGQLNKKLHEFCMAIENVRFVDSTSLLDSNGDGNLDPRLHTGDGLHLNASGYAIWTGNLRDKLNHWRTNAEAK